jgi:hypothetical protein
MRRTILGILIAISFAIPAAAQRLNLDVPNLGDHATEVVDVTLDGPMLRLAGKFLSADDREERAVRDMVQKLDGIYVRSYTFDKDWEYDRTIVDRMRAQLGAGWSKIVNVRGTRENVEIYTQSRGNQITGLFIISAERRELTLVNILGPIDLDRLASIEGEFGIPKIHHGKKDDDDDND